MYISQECFIFTHWLSGGVIFISFWLFFLILPELFFHHHLHLLYSLCAPWHLPLLDTLVMTLCISLIQHPTSCQTSKMVKKKLIKKGKTKVNNYILIGDKHFLTLSWLAEPDSVTKRTCWIHKHYYRSIRGAFLISLLHRTATSLN